MYPESVSAALRWQHWSPVTPVPAVLAPSQRRTPAEMSPRGLRLSDPGARPTSADHFLGAGPSQNEPTSRNGASDEVMTPDT